ATPADSSTTERLRFAEEGEAPGVGDLRRLTPREKLKDWSTELTTATPEGGIKFKRDSSPHNNLSRERRQNEPADGLLSGTGGVLEPLGGGSGITAPTHSDILYFGV
uniref:Uncharacterized protein n=1 Tax=Glossina austeni TaxID=7395 RepID=A0A1A9V2U4_GLOAU